jgi:hypothetical protein
MFCMKSLNIYGILKETFNFLQISSWQKSFLVFFGLWSALFPLVKTRETTKVFSCVCVCVCVDVM